MYGMQGNISCIGTRTLVSKTLCHGRTVSARIPFFNHELRDQILAQWLAILTGVSMASTRTFARDQPTLPLQ
jgi:hypothetical protein